jgi:hypothetical protein
MVVACVTLKYLHMAGQALMQGQAATSVLVGMAAVVFPQPSVLQQKIRKGPSFKGYDEGRHWLLNQLHSVAGFWAESQLSLSFIKTLMTRLFSM